MHRRFASVTEKEDKLLIILLIVVCILLVLCIILAHFLEPPGAREAQDYASSPLHLLMNDGHLAGV